MLASACVLCLSTAPYLSILGVESQCSGLKAKGHLTREEGVMQGNA